MKQERETEKKGGKPEKEWPLFSVIVLTYLQRHLIEECLDSILKQTYPNMELIVCDDCSADFDEGEISAYIEEHKEENLKNVVVFKQPRNVGTTLNAKTGIELSRGVYFKLHAGDDMLADEKVLRRMAKHFEDDEEAELFACRSVACKFDGTPTNDYYPSYDAYCRMDAAPAEQQFTLMATQSWGEFINAPAVFWRRSLYDEVGGFDLRYTFTEDWPMWLKITRLGHRITPLNEVTTVYRYGGISNDSSPVNRMLGIKHYRECVDMLEEYGTAAFEASGDHAALQRCRQSQKAIEARIVGETKWSEMTIVEKMAWKKENAAFLLNSWLYRKEKWGAGSFTNRNWLYAMVLCLVMYTLNSELLPGLAGRRGWAYLFLAALAVFAARYAWQAALKLYLRGRRRRLMKHGK